MRFFLSMSFATFFGLSGQVLGAQVRIQATKTVQEPDAYYIGMDLSASYGAVAVAFSNDSTMPIARVEGSDQYKALLAELAQQEKWEPTPPWIPVDPRQTAILSEMITDLKTRAEDYLGVKINSTLVATPALPYLYDVNVHASIEDAGLEDLDHTHVWIGYSFKQPQGAMAGWGIGMCRKWWNQSACDDEAGRWPRENPITVLYTSDALFVAKGDCKGIYGYVPWGSLPSSFDYTLGYSERDHNPDKSFYWAAVRERILRGVIGGSVVLARNPTVFVHGDKDAVDDPTFRQVLKDTISEILGDSTPIYWPDDAEFLVARGTASVARRGKYEG